MKEKTYQPTPWSLQDLYPAADSPEFEASFQELETLVTEFEKVREILSEDISVDAFMDAIHQLDKVTRIGHKMYAYVQLWYTQDTQNEKAMALMGRVDQFVTGLSNRSLFFTLWWKQVSDKTAQRLLDASGDYRYWLEQIRNFKDFTLSEPEEKVINLKDTTGFNTLNNIYDTITNRYTFKLTVTAKRRNTPAAS
jgi:oligoendopeptidase F